jgi:NhaA family Na+:H+ antiporter
MQLYGVAILCGIGFTMSLFIGGLTWPGRPDVVDAAKVGTLAGSLLAAIAGYFVLRFAQLTDGSKYDEEEARRLWAAKHDHQKADK